MLSEKPEVGKFLMWPGLDAGAVYKFHLVQVVAVTGLDFRIRNTMDLQEVGANFRFDCFLNLSEGHFSEVRPATQAEIDAGLKAGEEHIGTVRDDSRAALRLAERNFDEIARMREHFSSKAAA